MSLVHSSSCRRRGRFRKLWVLLCCVGLGVLPLAAVTAQSASASTTDPWYLNPGSTYYTNGSAAGGGGGLFGECNEVFHEVGTVADGYWIDIVCNAVVPDGDSIEQVVTPINSPTEGSAVYASSPPDTSYVTYPIAYDLGGSPFGDPEMCPLGQIDWFGWGNSGSYGLHFACQAAPAWNADPFGTAETPPSSTGGNDTTLTGGAITAHASGPSSICAECGSTSYHAEFIEAKEYVMPESTLGGPYMTPVPALISPTACSGNQLAGLGSTMVAGVGTAHGYGSLDPTLAVSSNGTSITANLFMQLDSITCGGSGGSSAATPSNNYVGGAGLASTIPCVLVSSTPLSTATADGKTSYPVTLNFTGPADAIWADPVDESTPEQTLPGGDTVSADAKEYSSPSSPITVSLKPTSGTLVDGANFWCVYDGVDYNWGSGNPSEGAPGPGGASGASGGSFDLSTCLATSGMSLTDPVSWITGGAKDGLCVLEWLFVPGSEISTLEQNFGIGSDAPTGSAPSAEWVGSIVSLFTSGPATTISDIQSSASSDDCSSSFDTIKVVGEVSHGVSLCDVLTSVSSNTSSAPWSFIRSIVLAGFLVGFFIGLVLLMRRTLESS